MILKEQQELARQRELLRKMQLDEAQVHACVRMHVYMYIYIYTHIYTNTYLYNIYSMRVYLCMYVLRVGKTEGTAP